MMYDLIYYFIFSLVKKRNPDPKFYAASFVTLTQLFQVLFVAGLVRKIFEIKILPHFSETYLINKLMIMPFLLIWLIIVHLWFKKHFKEIEEKFSDKKVITLKNGLIVFGALIIPLAIGILLLTN